MKTHTPGPWDAVDAEGQPQIVSRTNKLIAEVNTVVRFVYGRPDDPQADARLIAAAPELLEALESVTEAFYRESLVEHRGDVMPKVWAAIRKAKGESR